MVPGVVGEAWGTMAGPSLVEQTWSAVGGMAEQVNLKRTVNLKPDKKQHNVARRSWYLQIIVETEDVY